MKRKFKKYLKKIKKFMYSLPAMASCVITIVFFDVCINMLFNISIIDIIRDSIVFSVIFCFKKIRNVPEKLIDWWEAQRLSFHLSLIASLGSLTILSKIEYNLIKRIK